MAWAATVHNTAAVGAVAFVVVAFAAAEVVKTGYLSLSEPATAGNSAGLSFVGIPTAANRYVVFYPGLGSGAIDPRRQG